MKRVIFSVSRFLSAVLLTVAMLTAAQAQDKKPDKPNILFIMGDDIGWMQPSIYHRGLMVGETPKMKTSSHAGQ